MIEVRELREWDDGESGGLMGFYAKGHHDFYEFASAVNRETGADERYDTRWVDYQKAVRHEWWRNVPSSHGGMIYNAAEPRSRGAYPVTVTTCVDDAQRRVNIRCVEAERIGYGHGFAEGVGWVVERFRTTNPTIADQIRQMYREGAA